MTARLLLLTLALACDAEKGADTQDDTGPCYIDGDKDGVIATVDCDDGDPAIFPGAADGCDGLDNDCDGETDEDGIGGSVWYLDADEDGYGTTAATAYACEAPEGYADNAGDCDDEDAAQSPDAEESCDGEDNDCDGLIDDDPAGSGTVYLDYDGDGYGNPDFAERFCTTEEGYVETGGDCDDLDADNHPGADETCDGLDNDCDGTADDDPVDGNTYHLDADGDGFGGESGTTLACAVPDGYGEDASDCDDSDERTFPGAAEVCDDGVDNDCDGGKGPCGVGGLTSADDADVALFGVLSSDYFGRSADVGDVDGDGQDDLVVGASGVDVDTSYSAGAAYLVLGPVTASGSAADEATASITGSTDASYAYAGWSVAAPDLDGDGAAEMVTGAYGASASRGELYVLHGGADLAGAFGASGADATITGVANNDYLGFSAANAGDVNDDGLQDLLVGAYGNDAGGTGAGIVYVFFGVSTGYDGASPAGSADVSIVGATSGASFTYLGYAVDSAGDTDGDGVDDLLVGAHSYDLAAADAGGAFLFLGSSALSGELSMEDYDGIALGLAAYDYLGSRVSGAGDTNGDGYEDLLLGAYGSSAGDVVDAGAAWLVLGSLSGTVGTLAATATITGEASSDYLGEAVGESGDLDHDAIDDVVVGAFGEDTGATSAGAAYVFFGPLSGTVSAAAADAKLTGPGGGDGYVGRTIAGPMDANGDGVSDAVIGGYWVDTAAYDAGAVYVLLGGGL